MTRYVALLRAVNVGGTAKLPMGTLRSICAEAGFSRIETYIASGNVVFDSPAPAARIKQDLETRLAAVIGKPVGVVLRTAANMASVLAANPFPATKPSHTYAVFLDRPPPRDTLDHIAGCTDEEIRLGARELYVHYPSGMGRSRLRIPAAKDGTARNLNTVARLAELAARD